MSGCNKMPLWLIILITITMPIWLPILLIRAFIIVIVDEGKRLIWRT